MTKERTQYRQIFKATSLFGGVQVFVILISLIRGKVVAILLGTAGMGLNGLFMSTLNLIRNLTNLGLPQSAVKDIAAASGSDAEDEAAKTIVTFRRWVWLCAALGAGVCLGLAYYFSVWTFGNGDYTYDFMLLSITFIFGALTAGTYTVLQGLRKLKHLAQANILGSIAGLFVALPIYYFYGEKGIVPAIVAVTMTTFLVSLYFRSKLPSFQVNLSTRESFQRGQGMVKLGISMSLGMLLTSAVAYILNAYITRTGSLSDLGLFRAGETITVSYVGMVFTAMGTDYFPRLSKAIAEKSNWQTVVRQQTELVVIILGPILILLLATAPILIRLLLSSEFLAISVYLNWAILGLLLKGIVWSLGFVLLAQGDNRFYLITELIGNGILLVMNLSFYHFFGLEGLGAALFVSYLLNLLMMLVVVAYRYKFFYSFSFLRMLGTFFILLLAAWANTKFLGYPLAYTGNAILCLISGGIAFYELDKRMGIKAILESIKDKLRQK